MHRQLNQKLFFQHLSKHTHERRDRTSFFESFCLKHCMRLRVSNQSVGNPPSRVHTFFQWCEHNAGAVRSTSVRSEVLLASILFPPLCDPCIHDLIRLFRILIILDGHIRVWASGDHTTEMLIVGTRPTVEDEDRLLLVLGISQLITDTETE